MSKPEKLRKRLLGVGLGAMLTYAPGAWAFDIFFDYTFDTNNFFSTVESQNTLEAAASYFESIIQDDLTAIDSDPGPGGNDFSTVFSNPADGSSVGFDHFDVPADTIIVYVGGRDLGGALGLGGPGGFGVSGTATFVDNAISRGEGGGSPSAVQGVTATDFAPWGGSISFDTTTDWYFDDDVSTDVDIPFDSFDFYSVALHELGHVLGIGTADSWNNQIDTTTTPNTFTGTNATAANGGAVVALAGSGHWAEGTLSTVNGNTQEAAMDPTIANGQRKRFTELDNAALEDIGWELATASP